jgi:hypothetical protein
MIKICRFSFLFFVLIFNQGKAIADSSDVEMDSLLVVLKSSAVKEYAEGLITVAHDYNGALDHFDRALEKVRTYSSADKLLARREILRLISTVQLYPDLLSSVGESDSVWVIVDRVSAIYDGLQLCAKKKILRADFWPADVMVKSKDEYKSTLVSGKMDDLYENLKDSSLAKRQEILMGLFATTDEDSFEHLWIETNYVLTLHLPWAEGNPQYSDDYWRERIDLYSRSIESLSQRIRNSPESWKLLLAQMLNDADLFIEFWFGIRTMETLGIQLQQMPIQQEKIIRAVVAQLRMTLDLSMEDFAVSILSWWPEVQPKIQDLDPEINEIFQSLYEEFSCN